jgi:hypothetical protein
MWMVVNENAKPETDVKKRRLNRSPKVAKPVSSCNSHHAPTNNPSATSSTNLVSVHLFAVTTVLVASLEYNE